MAHYKLISVQVHQPTDKWLAVSKSEKKEGEGGVYCDNYLNFWNVFVLLFFNVSLFVVVII